MKNSLAKESGDDLAFDEFAGLVEMVVDDGVRRDAHRMVEGRQDVGRMDGVLGRRGGRRVRLAVDASAGNAAARDEAGIAVGPVIATVGGVAVAGGADAQARGASELADSQDERVLQHSALIHLS